jgi:hypothetical protein
MGTGAGPEWQNWTSNEGLMVDSAFDGYRYRRELLIEVLEVVERCPVRPESYKDSRSSATVTVTPVEF